MPSSPTSNQSNPAWSRDELVLALDLYLRHRDGLPGKNHPEVQALSQSLNLIGNATGVSKNQSFRNTNGVCMKLNNFRRWDPSYTNSGRTGLAKGNKDEELVWLEFANNPKRLAEVVAAINANVESGTTTPINLNEEEEPGFFEAEEGKVLTRVHRVRERDKSSSNTKRTKPSRNTVNSSAKPATSTSAKPMVRTSKVSSTFTTPSHCTHSNPATKPSSLTWRCYVLIVIAWCIHDVSG